MLHVEPEDLALVALGEPLADTARAHLAACPACAEEVESLAATVTVGREARDSLVPAPPVVWDRISAELGLGAGTVSAGAPTPLRTRARSTGHAARASRRMPWIAAAAAAGVLVGGAGGAWLMGRDTQDGTSVLAQATLDALPGWDASGQAWVEEGRDGVRHLMVQLDGGEASDGFHEVWLIDRDVTRLVSLGVIEGRAGDFTVPAGLDLDEFPVVDVSAEPFDGDPTHSGDSIIRGILGA